MPRVGRLGRWAGFGAGAALLLFLGWAMLSGRSGGLDLGAAPGPFTGRKLVALRSDPTDCRAKLALAGVRFTRLPPRDDGATCGWRDGLRLEGGGAVGPRLSPGGAPMTCPVAAALAMWDWSVVQPAARRYLGTPVVEIKQLGTYNCRRIAGSASWSEHSTANAIDVAGFRFADGRRLTIKDDWRGRGPEATFLHEVRTGACRVYATVLSPDYNRAHYDHLHLDQAARGELGWRSCR